jgi:MraZ protein
MQKVWLWINVGKVGKTGDKSAKMTIFTGEYTYSLDDKKRLAIPPKMRLALGQKGVITRGLDKCLYLFTAKEWEKMVEKISQLPLAGADSRSFARFFLTGAMEVSLDNLGRVLIPDFLKNYAGLNKRVVVAGVNNHIEIWDESKWREYREKTEGASEEIAERLYENKELNI